jgi:hypothetical protein
MAGGGGSVGGEARGLYQFANLAIWSTAVPAVAGFRMQFQIDGLSPRRLPWLPKS